MYNDFIPNCVAEYFREILEREEHEAELYCERMEHYKANRKKVDEALKSGLPVMDYGGYDACHNCKEADYDTQIDELDDFCQVICHNPDCPEHKKNNSV